MARALRCANNCSVCPQVCLTCSSEPHTNYTAFIATAVELEGMTVLGVSQLLSEDANNVRVRCTFHVQLLVYGCELHMTRKCREFIFVPDFCLHCTLFASRVFLRHRNHDLLHFHISPIHY
jgi:hypothetical protein